MLDLTPGEAEATLLFLDRCSLTGHQERHAMNVIVTKLSNYVQSSKEPAKEPAKKPAKKPAEVEADVKYPGDPA